MPSITKHAFEYPTNYRNRTECYMLFNSFEFIFLFAPCTFVLWVLLRRCCLSSAAVFVLLLASLFFYAYWNPPFILLLLGAVIVNYVFQRTIYSSMQKGGPSRYTAKYVIYAGVVLNLMFIAYFKYKNFILYTVDVLLGRDVAYPALFLPLRV